eukprot:272830_1
MLVRLCQGIRYLRHQKFYFCSNAIVEWRDIPNFDNYQISTQGNVYSKLSGKLLYLNYESRRKRNERIRLRLKNNDGEFQQMLLHRLILLTFNPIDNYQNLEVNHIDGDRYNN